MLNKCSTRGQPPGVNKMLVVLTVDVEPSVAGAFRGNPAHAPLIHELIAGEVDGKSEALGFLIDTLRQHGLIGTFFVETLHTRYFSDSIMGAYVQQMLDADQDVQLHLHPCWLAFEGGHLSRFGAINDSCSELDVPHLADLIGDGASQIGAWTGTRPSAMRTGNFSVGLSAFAAMGQSGLKYSSSICLAVQQPPEPELAVTGGMHEFAGIRELPVTCFADVGPVGHGRLRPMQVRSLTAREQIDLLNAAHACGNPIAVIVTHPFEFVKSRDFRYTALRPNRIVQARFRRLCAFLAENSRRFDVVPLPVAAEALDAHDPWTELSGRWRTALTRAIENALNDRLRFL
jgi:hypothetical protein